MERKKAAMLVLAAAAVLMLAGSAYAMSTPTVGLSDYRVGMMSTSGAGPMMGGFAWGGQATNQYMQQSMFQNMFQHISQYLGNYVGNGSQPYGPHLCDHNYTRMYDHYHMWDYNSNSTG